MFNSNENSCPENERKDGCRKVCIIGAGMSGILAFKYLLNTDVNLTVFEAKEGIGGVWRETFASTTLQTPRPAYQFTDFPWPSHVTDRLPTQSQVMDYLNSYAENFGLMDRIQFNSKVVGIRYIGEQSMECSGLWSKNGGPYTEGRAWEVGVQKRNGGSIEWHHFDFVVMCIGRYGDVPNIPSFPPNKGPELFEGKVLHTMDYSALNKTEAYELLRGKRVIVIGFQKSALDFAVECAEANQGGGGKSCTMIFRTVHWTVPYDHKCWGVPLVYLYGTRFTQFLLDKPNRGFLLRSISHLFAPLRWAISKFVEFYLLWKFPLRKYGLVPGHSFLQEISSCQIATLPEKLFSKAEEGLIQFRKASTWSFSRKGIIIDDITEVEADVVVLGTGYAGEKKLKTLLPKNFSHVLEKPKGVIPLYRGLIHPKIPQMAIMGYPESLSNLHSSEIRSQWLAHFLSGKFVLPSIKDMEAYTDRQEKFMKRITPFYWKTCHATFQISDNDNLCEDMGWKPLRKQNWFQELFSPYSNLDYMQM
ncbi:hypothetical protein SUGI_0070130 [Cryptomeria japonica]|uniref:probable flavin-containing monooxygenase 1 n=1 Tax=Cryptomeria japonica TaxID=3369 RepID=UPI002408A5D6|nr:probable flavin-containing monooxygenase 1 [Cryptomeria japonica]GLJ07579.1 hypothetical protein SUGI_0070130 [Cryptomeria japonica]